MPVVFVQINVVIKGAGAQGNDGTMIDGKGAILRGGRTHFRGGRLISELGLSPTSPLTLSPATGVGFHRQSGIKRCACKRSEFCGCY
jgi:hypothetical protein